MSSRFDLAWPRKRLEWQRRETWMIEAVLLERVLLAGQPQLKIVCRIAAIDEDLIDDPAARDPFWHSARARLGRLSRLQPRDCDEIERLLAKRVPKPVPRQAT
jgi:hypothetical protein